MEHDRTIERVPGETAASPEPTPSEITSEWHGARAMSAETQALATEIATALGETAPDPVGQIARAVDQLGVERARAFLTQVQDIEAGGGRMLPDSSRRRTPGGLFFLLVRQSADVSRCDKGYIFPHLFQQKKPRAATGDSATAAPASVA